MRLRNAEFAQKFSIVLLLSGLALLLVEVRFEHQVVLGEKWQSWIPLVYTAVMILAGALGLFVLEKGGRLLLFWGFAVSTIVGLIGFWFHCDGEPIKALAQVLAVICMKPGLEVTAASGPPVLAPLAFIGLGLLGSVISSFQPKQ